MLANINMNYLVSRAAAPGQCARQHRAVIAFSAADGDLVLAVGNDSQFAKFCELAERAGTGSGCRNADRVRHRDVLIPLLEVLLMYRARVG